MNSIHVPLFDLVLCVSNALDLVAPQVSNHHKQVAYIASEIAAVMGFRGKQKPV